MLIVTVLENKSVTKQLQKRPTVTYKCFCILYFWNTQQKRGQISARQFSTHINKLACEVWSCFGHAMFDFSKKSRARSCPRPFISRPWGLASKHLQAWPQRLRGLTLWRASCKKGVYRILAYFQFLQDRANFWQTDLFWHGKHRSVIVSVDLRFVLQK